MLKQIDHYLLKCGCKVEIDADRIGNSISSMEILSIRNKVDYLVRSAMTYNRLDAGQRKDKQEMITKHVEFCGK